MFATEITDEDTFETSAYTANAKSLLHLASMAEADKTVKSYTLYDQNRKVTPGQLGWGELPKAWNDKPKI